jgi:hypothetical protein
MPEWIREPTLPVGSPWHGVDRDLVATRDRTGGDRTLYEGIGIVTKDLDTHRGHAQILWSVPPITRGLSDKERGTENLQADNRPEIPELRRAEGAFVPLSRTSRVCHRQHD